MPVNTVRRYEWQVAWWSLFALAFVVMGAVPLENIRRQTRVADQGPMNSTDAAFAQTVRVSATRIAALVRDLPRDRPVAIVLHDADILGLPASQLSAICWPRPTPQLRVPGRGDPQLAKRLRDLHPSAAFFVSAEIPASLPRGESLSAELQFVPLP